MDKYISILLYYFIFLAALLLFIRADKSHNNKRVKFYIICGIVLLSLFAGLRGSTVGWDTADTVQARFERVKYFNSLSSLMSRREFIKEPIYWIISYFILRVTGNSRVFLFVIQLLTVGPIGYLAYEKRDKVPVSIMMTTYMMLFYQLSFNNIRQSVAAAFMLLAYSKLEEKSYVAAVVLSIFCCLFHNSGFIGVGLILFTYLLTHIKKSSGRILVLTVYIALGVAFFFTWKSVISWFVEGDFINGSYDSYLAIFSGDVESKYTTFRYRNIVIEALRILCTAIVLFVLKGEHSGEDIEIRMLKYSNVLSLIIFSIITIGFNSTLGHRATLYLDYLQILLFAYYFPKRLFDNGKISRGCIVIPRTGVQYCLVYCVAFNFLVYMLINFGHTLPYQLS